MCCANMDANTSVAFLRIFEGVICQRVYVCKIRRLIYLSYYLLLFTDVMKEPKDGLTLGTNTNSETSELESKMDSSGVQNNRAGVSGHFKLTDSLNTAESIMPSEEDCNGNESGQDNVSTNSFEFQRGERTVQHPVIGPFIRNAPSKWNDAEKWIVNRNLMHSNPDALKKTIPQGPKSRQAIISNCVRVAPEALNNAEQKHQLLQVADTKSSSGAKFSFDPNCVRASSESANARSVLTDLSPVTGDLGSVTRPQNGLNHKNKKISMPGVSASAPKGSLICS